MLPNKLSKQIKFLEENPDCVMCYHDMLIRDYERGTEYRYNDIYCGQKPLVGQIGLDLMEKGCFVSGISALLRWKDVKNIKHRRVSIYDDWCYFIEVAMHGKVGYLDETLGIYRRHKNNITRNCLDDEGPIHILKYIREKYNNNPHIDDAFYRGLIRHYLAFAWKHLLKCNFSRFAKLYKSGIHIACRNFNYSKTFLFWNFFLFWQRICLLIRTGKIFR